jgi:hypothetical protein
MYQQEQGNKCNDYIYDDFIFPHVKPNIFLFFLIFLP